MKLLKRIREYKKSYARETVVQSKSWFLFRWEIIVILCLTLMAALLNEIPNWLVKPINGKIDPILSYPLRNNIIYSSFSIFITIGVAIFIGVFSEMGKFTGKFGSAIFVLVPSFVWLLSDRSDNHIEDVLKTAKFLGTIIFWSIFGLCVLFLLMTIAKQIFATLAVAHKTKLRIEFIYNYINRFNVVITNILIVLMLGYSFINYGIFSLHLADNKPADMAADPNLGPYNLHSENFTLYIALIAVLFALLMVIIGLTNVFSSKDYGKQTNFGATEIYLDTTSLDYAEKESIQDTSELDMERKT